MCKQEFFFIKFVVAPLWQLVDQFLDGSCRGPLSNLMANQDRWSEMREEEKQKSEKSLPKLEDPEPK